VSEWSVVSEWWVVGGGGGGWVVVVVAVGVVVSGGGVRCGSGGEWFCAMVVAMVVNMRMCVARDAINRTRAVLSSAHQATQFFLASPELQMLRGLLCNLS
jgi:hypothetical protein